MAEQRNKTIKLPGDPARGAERYRHKKSGTTYELAGLATVQAATGPIEEGEQVVVYRSEQDGRLWAREQGEFSDGRFERLDAE